MYLRSMGRLAGPIQGQVAQLHQSFGHGEEIRLFVPVASETDTSICYSDDFWSVQQSVSPATRAEWAFLEKTSLYLLRIICWVVHFNSLTVPPPDCKVVEDDICLKRCLFIQFSNLASKVLIFVLKVQRLLLYVNQLALDFRNLPADLHRELRIVGVLTNVDQRSKTSEGRAERGRVEHGLDCTALPDLFSSTCFHSAG